MTLNKTQVATVVEILGLVALAVGAFLSLRHLAIAFCVVGGAAAAYVGNRIRVGK